MNRLVVLAALLAFLCLTSCGDSNSGVGQAKLRTINVSPDSGAIDVFLDGNVEFDSVRYTLAPDYIELDEGSHDLKITLDDSFTTFFDSSRNLAEDAEYTLFFFDFVENGTGALVRDDNNRPDSGLVKLRIIHGAPSLDDVDLYITSPSASLSNSTPTFESARFKEISSYVESVEDVYRIRAVTRGTTDVVADSGPIGLEASRVLTILLVDNLGGGAPFRFAIVVDS